MEMMVEVSVSAHDILLESSSSAGTVLTSEDLINIPGGVAAPPPVNAEMGRGMGQAQALTKSYTPEENTIAIQEWDPVTPYLNKIELAAPDQHLNIYLQQRNSYSDSPAFFLDCADLFLKRDQMAIGLRVLSNIAELQLENPAFLRILAHRLSELGEIDLSIGLFETVLKMRPEEPQSYRDLALVLSEQKEFKRAMELLNQVVMDRWDRFYKIEVIALMELNRIIPLARAEGIEEFPIDSRLVRLLDVDIRIVLTWDADMTDIDLWVTEPSGERHFINIP